jgi:hypothetical protein
MARESICNLLESTRLGQEFHEICLQLYDGTHCNSLRLQMDYTSYQSCRGIHSAQIRSFVIMLCFYLPCLLMSFSR